MNNSTNLESRICKLPPAGGTQTPDPSSKALGIRAKIREWFVPTRGAWNQDAESRVEVICCVDRIIQNLAEELEFAGIEVTDEQLSDIKQAIEVRLR